MSNETEKAFERMQTMLAQKEALIDNSAGEIVNLSLTTEERLEVVNEVMQLLDEVDDHRDAAHKVVGILNTHINKKMQQAKDRKKGKSPIFRRVDE